MGRKALIFFCVFAISLGVMFFSTKYARRLITGNPDKADVDGGYPPPSVEVPTIPLKDITKESGIAFRHTTPKGVAKLLPETMSGGVCVLDIDNDGLPDLFFSEYDVAELGGRETRDRKALS